MKMRGFGWLSVIASLVKGVLTNPKLPPLPFCPICRRPTKWFVEGKVWGCEIGHRFDVSFKAGDDPLLHRKFPPGDI